MSRQWMVSVVFTLVTLFTIAPQAASTHIVSSLADDGSPGTLRHALADASPGDTIDVAVTGTITLTATLVIDKNLTIVGPGASSLTVSGNNAVVVFQINSGVAVAIADLAVKNGGGTWSGGAFNNAGRLSLTNTIVSNNSAFQGAAVWNTGTLDVTDSVMSGNRTGSCCGGAVANLGTVTLTRTELSQNSVAFFGGALYNDGTAVLIDTTLSNNSAYLGGGIQNNATLRITNSTINGNTASFGGAGVSTHGRSFITNSTISKNVASVDGGGIYNYGGGDGGLRLSHSTVAANSAARDGSNVWSGGTLWTRSTIVANGTIAPNCHGSAVSSGFNLSDDASCATGFADPTDLNGVAAGLDPAGLQDNGGPTRTIGLLSTSVAIDALGSAACVDIEGNEVAADQRGVSRPQGPGCDAGAVEYKSPDSTPPVITPHVSGVAGQNGWYLGPVTVTWSVSEEESPSTLETTGCDTTTIEDDTVNTTLTCVASSAGGEASQSVTVKIDSAAPSITLSANPGALWPPNGRLSPVALSGVVTDLASGIDATSLAFSVRDEYGKVEPAGPIAIDGDGRYLLSISLEASRLGGDTDGRQYSILVSGRDDAGHTASATTIVTVQHDQRK